MKKSKLPPFWRQVAFLLLPCIHDAAAHRQRTARAADHLRIIKSIVVGKPKTY